MEPCANCGRSIDTPYCPQCGQRHRLPGIKLNEVISEFASGLFNVDAPILRTFRDHIKGPGNLTRSFLAGKRATYTPPVRYFLFGIAYYFIMRWLLDWDPVDAAIQATTGADPMSTPAMRVNHWMSRNVNLLLPLWLIMIAFFDRVLFPRAALRWVERLVHYLFAAGTYLLATTTLLPLIKLWPVLQLINFVLIFSLMIWSCISLHKRSAWNIFKAVLMVPVSFWIYVLVSTTMVSALLGIPLNEVFTRPGQ